MKENPTSLPRGADKARAVRTMFDAIAPRYDLVNRVMTFGLDVSWRRKTVRSLGLPRESLVLDVACGTGDLCRDLERAGYEATGVDVSAGMLAAAHTEAPLIQGDALALPFKEGRLDGSVCGFALRNVVDLDALFAEIARVVRKDGRVAFLEVGEPRSSVLRAFHHAYFHRVVPLIGGLLSDRAAYRYLPASTAYLPPEGDLLERMGTAGFSRTSVTRVGLGAARVIAGSRT